MLRQLLRETGHQKMLSQMMKMRCQASNWIFQHKTISFIHPATAQDKLQHSLLCKNILRRANNSGGSSYQRSRWGWQLVFMLAPLHAMTTVQLWDQVRKCWATLTTVPGEQSRNSILRMGNQLTPRRGSWSCWSRWLRMRRDCIQAGEWGSTTMWLRLTQRHSPCSAVSTVNMTS